MDQENQTPHKRRVRYKGKYPKKFEEKILKLKDQLGENYVEIIENDTSVVENII